MGFLLVVAGFFSYPFFILFPRTRDFPWANLLLFGTGGILLVLGLARAFGRPQPYRGKTSHRYWVCSVCWRSLFLVTGFSMSCGKCRLRRARLA